MTIGEKIRFCRISKGLTQVELAKMLNTTKQTIGKYEKGIVTEIPLSRIKEISAILECEPEYLCGWENDQRKENEKYPITDSEQDLLSSFRKLNKQGQEKAVEYIDMLLLVPDNLAGDYSSKAI